MCGSAKLSCRRGSNGYGPGLEQRLYVRKADHEKGVRLIRNCLHPDKHPEQAERCTRAWQAFERLLAPAKKPAPEAWDDDIPF
jgi:hypothetical protein